jgi:hypothetical protein
MEFLKQWTFCICVTLVVSVLFSLLAPRGRLSNFYKIIISMFIFISFLYPLKDFNIKNINFQEIYVTEDYYNEQVNSYQIMINNQVNSLLKDNQIIGADISSEIEINDNEISVKMVQVAVPDEYDLTDVKNLIFDNIGINAKVIYIGQ